MNAIAAAGPTTGTAGRLATKAQPHPLPVRGVLFDLDGTLVDSAPDLGQAVNRMRERRGLAWLDDAVLRPHASHGARGLVCVGFGITPEHDDYAALRSEFLTSYAEAICERTVIFPGVDALLDRLDSSNLQW